MECSPLSIGAIWLLHPTGLVVELRRLDWWALLLAITTKGATVSA